MPLFLHLYLLIFPEYQTYLCQDVLPKLVRTQPLVSALSVPLVVDNILYLDIFSLCMGGWIFVLMVLLSFWQPFLFKNPGACSPLLSTGLVQLQTKFVLHRTLS